jgi:hypothetical protein
MAKQKTPSFGIILLGEVIMWSLPMIIFMIDGKVFPYRYIYVVLGLIICLPASFIASKRKNINGTLIQKLLPVLPILIPFWLLAAYPFSVNNFLITIVLVIAGLILPFWSRYLTWCFYTLGGKVPLPETHNWLANKENKKDTGKKYQNFIQGSVVFGLIVGMASVTLSRTVGYSGTILLMKFLSMFVVFSMGLTLGTELKKKQLGL